MICVVPFFKSIMSNIVCASVSNLNKPCSPHILFLFIFFFIFLQLTVETMDFDSSSKFIASLAKFLQSLCNGYVDFDKGVEVIGHIYLNVDSDTGKKIDYVLNEKVCKNDNSVTFISHSFHAQPAEKPAPAKKESEKQNEDTVVMEDNPDSQSVPASTNVGTIGSYGEMRSRGHNSNYSSGSKRPGSPMQRQMGGRAGFSGKSPRYQDSPMRMGRNSISHQTPRGGSGLGDLGFDNYQEEDDGYNDQSSQLDLDQKPIIDHDISIVKEEASQLNSGAFHGLTSGKFSFGFHFWFDLIELSLGHKKVIFLYFFFRNFWHFFIFLDIHGMLLKK